MLGLIVAALAGVELSVDCVGGTIGSSERMMLQSTLGSVASFYRSALGMPLPTTIPLHLTVYEDRAAFEEHRRRSGSPSWSTGWFRTTPGQPPEAVLWGGPFMHKTLLHEASHYLVNRSGRPLPPWLNEGLAQVMETAAVRGNLLTVSPPPRYRALVQGLVPSIDTVLDHPGRWIELPEEEVVPLYAQAWMLTALLLSSTEGQRTVAAIVDRYRTDPSPRSVRAAIDATFPGGLRGLQSRYQRWVPRDSLPLPTPIQPYRTAPRSSRWVRCPNGALARSAEHCPRSR